MTDKERLERIIQMQYDGYTIWDMGEDDLVWLIEQAGRVQELERKIERYREALTFYAEKSNYDYDVKVDSIGYIGDQSDMKFYRLDSAILNDRGEKARQALEGEE